MMEKRVFSLYFFFAFDGTFCFLANLHNKDIIPTFNCNRAGIIAASSDSIKFLLYFAYLVSLA
jgi:hypothetical protein